MFHLSILSVHVVFVVGNENLRVEPVEKKPILAGGPSQRPESRSVEHHDLDQRFSCSMPKDSGQGVSADKKLNIDVTNTLGRVCADNCFSNVNCSGFVFNSQYVSTPNFDRDRGKCIFYTKLEHDIPSEATAQSTTAIVFCKSKRCVGGEVTNKCSCYDPLLTGTQQKVQAITDAEGQNVVKEVKQRFPQVCDVGSRCRADGTCAHYLVCKKDSCKLALANEKHLAKCLTTSVVSQESQEAKEKVSGGECAASQHAVGCKENTYCTASQILRANCTCADNDYMWASTRECHYNDDKMDDENELGTCFCTPRDDKTKTLSQENLCTKDEICTELGVCICKEGSSKVYDAATDTLVCRAVSFPTAVVCCSDGVVHFGTSKDNSTACFDPAHLYDASKTCSQHQMTLCTFEDIRGSTDSGAMVQAMKCGMTVGSYPTMAWVIPKQNCVVQEATYASCYCQEALDVCTRGQICHEGGCIDPCPANTANDKVSCGCAAQSGKSVEICVLGQRCKPALGSCEGDGFVALHQGTCYSPINMTEDSGCSNTEEDYAPAVCAARCHQGGHNTCVCHGFVTYTVTEDTKTKSRCRFLYQKVELSAVRQGDECEGVNDKQDATVYVLQGDRLCPRPSLDGTDDDEIRYEQCICGRNREMCTKGMKCDGVTEKCLNKCDCNGDPYWGIGPECTEHEGKQCSKCKGILPKSPDGVCQAAPNEVCYAPDIEASNMGQKVIGTPKTPCALDRDCVTQENVNTICPYDDKKACICRPLTEFDIPGVASGMPCGGNPNMKCNETSEKCFQVKVANATTSGKVSQPKSATTDLLCNDTMPLEACVCASSSSGFFAFFNGVFAFMKTHWLEFSIAGGVVALLILSFVGYKFWRGRSAPSTRPVAPLISGSDSDVSDGEDSPQSTTNI